MCLPVNFQIFFSDFTHPLDSLQYIKSCLKERADTPAQLRSLISFSVVRLKDYCTVFQHALKSREITDIVSSERMSKTARKKSKRLKSYKELKF